MTMQRDPDRLLQAYLDEGPEVLPDRVLHNVQDDIHRVRQRAAIGPWRQSSMRTLIAAAAVVVIVAVGGGLYWATRSHEPSVGTQSSPTSTPQLRPQGTLTQGTTYAASDFGEPFQFTLPSGTDVPPFQGDIWDADTFRLRPVSSSGGGAITFHDDVRLLNDFCHPTGTVDDVPATVQKVGTWIKSMRGVAISKSATLETADGRTVPYWDIKLGPSCIADENPGKAVVSFSAGEKHRIYAVPTPNDVFVVFTWGAGYKGEGDEALARLNPMTDSIIESMVEIGGA
jgi:hypothetical protein